jgi:hypothetical protein
MKTKLFVGAVASIMLAMPVQAGLFKMDFGTLQNDVEGLDLTDWDEFPTWNFADFDNEIATWNLTNFSQDGDNDVTLTIIDNATLTDELGLDPPFGMIHNNPVPQLLDVVYDGIDVPAVVKDDYLYRNPDTAGTELLFRFANLNPGKYNVTMFMGRTNDNGQYAKLWVESDINGSGEPVEENTGNFAGRNPDTGEENPEGNPVTKEVEIKAGEYLWYGHMEDNQGGISGIIIRQTMAGGGLPPLQAGDADRDLDFDQLDLVRVQVAAKYLTGRAATWGEGDWNGAPGGNAETPPAGDGLFNQVDIIKALGAGLYLTGKYAAIATGGSRGDGQTSIVYNANTGEVAVDAPAATPLTSINIDSATGIFTGAAAQNLGGSFDNDSDNNIFKATFGSSFGSLSFGTVAQAALPEAFVAGDLSVVGSLAGGGALGNVDLIYIPVPEPATLTLLVVGLLFGINWFNRRVRTSS